jgi:hypothetical protein
MHESGLARSIVDCATRDVQSRSWVMEAPTQRPFCVVRARGRPAAAEARAWP